jgi:hypothetical protein
MRTRFRVALASLCVLMGALGAQAATASAAYNPIVPTKANETVVMDGKHLTVQQLVDVARHGAKVELSADARQRSMNAYLLLLQGARENMPIYFFNRGTGSGRQQPIFSGDPLSTTVDPSLTCPTSMSRARTATSCSSASCAPSGTGRGRASARRWPTRRSSGR